MPWNFEKHVCEFEKFAPRPCVGGALEAPHSRRTAHPGAFSAAMPTTVMSDFARPQSDKYESEVQSKGIVDASDGGPVKVTAMDGKKYIDAKGGINYDVGEINRNYKAGDARSGKVILNNDGDGMTEFASGLKRFNAHEQYMKHLEAQDKYSQHVEYTFDVDLKAAEGKSVDANIERERVRLAKESKAREAARQAKMAKENAKRAAKLEKDAVHGKYATIVDDDIMDEAAGRERLRLAAEGQARRQANIEALQEKQTHEVRSPRPPPYLLLPQPVI